MSQNHNHKSNQKCQFCTPKTVTVKDSNGKDTKQKELQHDVTVPHPTIFGVGESKNYFK